MSKTRNLSILRTSGAGVVQRLAQLIASLITLPLALHTLGLANFGVWGAATSLVWLSTLLTLGFGAALITLIPRGLAAGQTAENRSYVTASLYSGAALAAVLLAGIAVTALLGAPLPSGPFLIAGIALILNIPLSVSVELWLALQKGHVAAFWNTGQTLLALGFMVLGAFAGANTSWMTAAVYGAMLLANGGSLAHVLYVHSHIRPLRRFSPAGLRTVLAQGSLLFAVAAAMTCARAFDNVMALMWLGPAASAQMAVATRVCSTGIGLVSAITQPFWPSFAEALAAQDKPWARRGLWLGTLGVVILAAGGSLVLIMAGAPVLHWWLRQNMHLSPALLWSMAGWIFLVSITNIPGSLLNAASRLKAQILILTGVALGGFVLKYFAAKIFGVTGILAVSPLLWAVFIVPAYFVMAWRVVR